ncbi:hypothetical protein OG264_00830 [Streptomyces xanthophaeus]|nr:hypothetical protein OG264_00830 [Streptomyces xanthophaeus]WST64857.1 hypothetical protein OG605_37530 [Streptomyces xanthophaeus]
MRGGAPLVLHESIDQDRVLGGLAVLSDHPCIAPRPAHDPDAGAFLPV